MVFFFFPNPGTAPGCLGLLPSCAPTKPKYGVAVGRQKWRWDYEQHTSHPSRERELRKTEDRSSANPRGVRFVTERVWPPLGQTFERALTRGGGVVITLLVLCVWVRLVV